MVYRASAGGGSGASGTVNSGTATQVAYYATTGTAVSGSNQLTFSTTNGEVIITGSNVNDFIDLDAANVAQIRGSTNGGGIKYQLLHNQFAPGLRMSSDFPLQWNDATGLASGSRDTGLQRGAVSLVQFTNGATGTIAGAYFNWGGQARVSADVSFVSTATLANVTGLSTTVKGGRTYNFNVVLYTTANVAGGIKAAVNATAAATFVRYEGYSMHVNTLLGQTRATAVATAVGGTTTAIAATVFICGTITPSADGSFTVQAAQNATVASATVVLAGSYMEVNDCA